MVRFVTFFQRGGFILRPSFSQDCNCLEIYIAFVWSMIIQSSTQRPYGLFTSFAYRTVLLRNLHSARTGFIFTQLPYGPRPFECNTPRSIPYGTILHFHLQGEGVPRPLARSHALLPWSRVLACATTVSPFPTCPSHDVMSTFECPKVLNPVRLLGTCTVRVSCHTVRASVRTFGSHLDINTVRCYTSNRTG